MALFPLLSNGALQQQQQQQQRLICSLLKLWCSWIPKFSLPQQGVGRKGVGGRDANSHQ